MAEKEAQSFEQKVRKALNDRFTFLAGQQEQYRQAIIRAREELKKLEDDAIVVAGAMQELSLVLKDHFVPEVKDEMTEKELSDVLGGTDGDKNKVE